MQLKRRTKFGKAVLTVLVISCYIPESVGKELPKLRSLSQDLSRIGRQFADIGEQAKVEGESMVSMSLVDALQKWADALEEQISGMRLEMVSLLTSNVQLKEKVMAVEMDNQRLTQELSQSTQKLDELSGVLWSNLTHFDMTTNSLKDGLFKAEAKLMTFEQALSSNTNTSMGIIERLRKVEDDVRDIQDETGNDLLISGQSFGNTTVFLTSKIEEISERSNLIKQEIANVVNQTLFVDDKLQRFISKQNHITGGIEESIKVLTEDNKSLTDQVHSLRHEFGMVKSETNRINVFFNTMQSHILTLSQNVTTISNNLTSCIEDMDQSKDQINSVVSDVEELKSIVEKFSQVGNGQDSRFDEVEANLTNVKENLVGLGNYINNINADVSQLLVSFENYAKKMAAEVTTIKANFSELVSESSATKTMTTDLTQLLQNLESDSSSMKNEVSGLSDKVLGFKSTLFEQTNEMTTVRDSQLQLQSLIEKMEKEFVKIVDMETMSTKHEGKMFSEVEVVKNDLDSLKETLLSLRSQTDASEKIDSGIEDLTTDISSIRNELKMVSKDLSTIKPEVFSLSTDVAGFRESIQRISKASLDPDRFSCAVTSEEIRLPGVITYSVCNVNSNEMMNPATGHLSIKKAGDYFISFSANLVSVKSQAIWCALYKQSASKEGWEVLGMINNYQRDAGSEDDRDSGSMSLISQFEEGDQVWVEWRGFGESFLYSNPYRLISFTGFLLHKSP